MSPGEIEKQNSLQKVLAYIVVMPAFLGFLNVILPVLGLASITSICTALIYIFVLVKLIVKAGITLNDLFLLLLIYMAFAHSYFIFPATRSEYFTQGMIILYAFYLPYCVIGIRKIGVWEGFFDAIGKLSLLAIGIGILILAFLPYQQYLDYMDYSYSLLPAVCSVYYAIHYWDTSIIKRNRWIRTVYYIAFAAGILEMLAFGARAPVFFSLLFVFVSIILDRKKSTTRKTILAIFYIALALLMIVFLDDILMRFSGLRAFSNSYIIRRYLSGRLAVSSSRDRIWISCITRLNTMGLSVSGFFGDRAYCDGIYPHNIVLEILMSWGWVIGGVMIIYLTILIIKGLKMNTEVTLFFLFAVFARYLVSGTYIREGRFWITLFVLVAVATRKHIKLVLHH